MTRGGEKGAPETRGREGDIQRRVNALGACYTTIPQYFVVTTHIQAKGMQMMDDTTATEI